MLNGYDVRIIFYNFKIDLKHLVFIFGIPNAITNSSMKEVNDALDSQLQFSAAFRPLITQNPAQCI